LVSGAVWRAAALSRGRRSPANSSRSGVAYGPDSAVAPGPLQRAALGRRKCRDGSEASDSALDGGQPDGSWALGLAGTARRWPRSMVAQGAACACRPDAIAPSGRAPAGPWVAQPSRGLGNRRDLGGWPSGGQIVVGLEVHPELRAGVERLGEQPGRFGRDTPTPANNLIDPLNGHTEVGGEGDLSDSKGLKELEEENLAWMGGSPVGRKHSDVLGYEW